MLACTASRCSVLACRNPVAPRAGGAARVIRPSSRRAVQCSAEEPGSSGGQPASEQPPAAPPAAQQQAPPAAKTDDRFDYRDAPDALGPVGNFFMATLLIFLCGASVFFTVGRQFQADLVPLNDEYAAMMAEAQAQRQ
ncbi:hypothetical protein ABPG75_008032 [Micractinium tetrahymenae]